MARRLTVIVALLVVLGSLEALAAPAQAPYLGTWGDHLSRAEMYDRGFDPLLAGTFRLVLRPNGTYTTFNSWDKAARGTYAVSGRRIVFANDSGCDQGGLEGKGVYTWSVSNGQLRLKQPRFGSDPCGGRAQTLTYPVWTKKA
jgi:hypothetical protein